MYVRINLHGLPRHRFHKLIIQQLEQMQPKRGCHKVDLITDNYPPAGI